MQTENTKLCPEGQVRALNTERRRVVPQKQVHTLQVNLLGLRLQRSRNDRFAAGWDAILSVFKKVNDLARVT